MVLTCLFVGSKNGGSTFISGGTVDDSSDSCSVLSGLLIASVAKLPIIVVQKFPFSISFKGFYDNQTHTSASNV